MNRIDIPVFKATLLDELRSELDTTTEAHGPVVEPNTDRPPVNRSVLLKVAAAAVVLVGLGALGITRSNNPPAYALTQTADGVIVVTWDTGFEDGEALEKGLRDAGVDITVDFLKGSPSLVGSFTALYPSESGSLASGITYDENALTIDTSQLKMETTIEIAVASDEPYEAMGSAFDHDEILDGLACAFPAPMQVADIAPLVAGRDVEIVWNLNHIVDAPVLDAPEANSESNEYQPIGLQSEFVEEPPAGTVLSALSSQPGTVMIDVLADGEPIDAAQFFVNMGNDACTPERATRWNR